MKMMLNLIGKLAFVNPDNIQTLTISKLDEADPKQAYELRVIINGDEYQEESDDESNDQQ